MQALLFMAIFSLFMSIATNIVVSSGPSSKQLTNQRIAETEAFFKNIAIVINDITRNAFQATPPTVTDPIALIRNTLDLAQLGSGRWADPALDAWGNTLTGFMVRENRVFYSNGPDNVVAPITAIALISPGPNRELETPLPSTITIATLQGILPPVGSDDIVTVFTNEDAQRQNWALLQHKMDRIAAAEMRYYQIQAFSYRVHLMDLYVQSIRDTGVLVPPDISSMMATDPNAPQFLDLNSDANRRLLGVDDDFATIERTLSSGGRFKVNTISNPDKSVTLQLVNDPGFPTPWNSGLSYNQTLKGNM